MNTSCYTDGLPSKPLFFWSSHVGCSALSLLNLLCFHVPHLSLNLTVCATAALKILILLPKAAEYGPCNPRLGTDKGNKTNRFIHDSIT